jgi:hypothetical protein
MTKQEDNKAIVGRWFGDFWGKTYNPKIVDEIASPDMLLHYSLHEPRRGREDIKAFMADFRRACPDLNFWGAATWSLRAKVCVSVTTARILVGEGFDKASTNRVAEQAGVSVGSLASGP